MKLRSRLLSFSAAQLAVFGMLFAVGYYQFHARMLPMLETSLHHKAESSIKELGAELDVALGADDQRLIAKVVNDVVSDEDFRFIEIRDAAGKVRFRSGTPVADAFSGAAYVAQHDGDTVRAWTQITIEQVPLGTIAVVYDTSQIDALRRWTQIIGAIALVVWLAMILHSLMFAASFVRPIRAMMTFTNRVAGGELGGSISTDAPGELADLTSNLNQMSAELASRAAESKRAASKEAALKDELMAVSRMAGMAEVATGVLHNVGNVLNSLNVSVSLVGDRLRQSKVASLTRTVEMFAQHPGGLVGFLSTDKGKLIPQFLASVTQRLAEENAQVCTELDSVVHNVEHIKTIVATQQTYAQVVGVSEPIELGALIDDALHMSEASFARHQIELVKDYGNVPTLNTDRHKLLQIMINMISNARHALKAGGTDKKLTVSLHRHDDRVTIVVRDTGIGIPAENLRRVFQHGFTTKKGGHGFGLHSCANAARELGGTITVASDGTDQGATFTLELPIEAPERRNDRTN